MAAGVLIASLLVTGSQAVQTCRASLAVSEIRSAANISNRRDHRASSHGGISRQRSHRQLRACDGHPIASSLPAANGRETVDLCTEPAGHSCSRTGEPGEFGYDIPVAPGSYELRLFFVSPQRSGAERMSAFNVALNGKPLLTAFDINLNAKAADVAEEQVFRDVTPGEDGFVRLWFSNHVGSPVLNALELVPGIPGKLKPIRILTQPTSFVDHKGQRWRADDYYLDGYSSTERRKVTGTEDPELFGAERFGHFSYSIPVDKRGRYTVILHFAELYYGPQLPEAEASAPGFPRVLQWADAAAGFRHLTRKPAAWSRHQDFLQHRALRTREDQSRFRARREQCDGVRNRGARRVPLATNRVSR